MASINEKLNYINETKSLIKDKLNNLGSEITNQTTFRNYANKIEDLYDEWPKISDTDTNITLNNTKKAKMNIQLKGNTNQFTTTGKNKFNPTILLQEENYNTYNSSTELWTTTDLAGYSRSILYSAVGYSADRDISKLIKLNTGTYTLKFYDFTNNTGSTNSLEYAFYDNTGTYVSRALIPDGVVTFTVSSDNTYLDIRRYGSSGTVSFSKIQLEINSSATDYEPYTGGIASPNSDYPQDIEVVTGENIVYIEGKNLFNKNNTTTQVGYFTSTGKIESGGGSTITTSYTKIEPNVQMYLSGEGNIFENVCYYDKNKNFIERVMGTNSKNINKNAYYIRFQISTSSFNLNTIQLEKGSTATIYQSYENQIYLINLETIELCKIENTQDYIYKNNSKWYKKPMILKINSYNGETISTSYKSTTGSLTTGATVYYINPNNNPDGIEITNTTLITQLNTLEQVVSYNGQTNISQENDNLPFIISASALLKNSN